MAQALPSAGEINIRGWGGGGGGSNFVTTNNPFQGGTANSSPANGTSLESFLQVLWDNSPAPVANNNGTTTIWNNQNGTGIFYNAGVGTVNSNFGNRFTGVNDNYGVILPGVTIYRGQSDSYNANIIQNHVYQNRGFTSQSSSSGGGDFGGIWDNFNKNIITTTNAVAGIFETGAKLARSTISTVTAFNQRALTETLADAKLIKVAGSLSFIGNLSQVGYATYQWISDPTAGNFTRVAVQASIIGVESGLNKRMPGLGLLVGFGLSAVESVYGGQLYDYIDSK